MSAAEPSLTVAATDMATVEASDRVQWIRAHSGLSWRHMGLMFGVGHRAVHMWANGGRINATQVAHLDRLEQIIHDLESDIVGSQVIDPDLPGPIHAAMMCDLVHARLHAQHGNAIGGTSIVDAWRRERSSGPTWGAPFPPEYLVGTVSPSNHAEDHP